MEFKINEVEVKTELEYQNAITIDKPNINVKSKEIRIKYISGTVSITHITITPQKKKAEIGVIKKEVAKNTYEEGDCLSNTMNCVFSENQLKDIKCSGVLVKISAKASNKNLACKYKCMKKVFDSKEECADQCPETLKCKAQGSSWTCATE